MDSLQIHTRSERRTVCWTRVSGSVSYPLACAIFDCSLRGSRRSFDGSKRLRGEGRSTSDQSSFGPARHWSAPWPSPAEPRHRWRMSWSSQSRVHRTLRRIRAGTRHQQIQEAFFRSLACRPAITSFMPRLKSSAQRNVRRQFWRTGTPSCVRHSFSIGRDGWFSPSAQQRE